MRKKFTKAFCILLTFIMSAGCFSAISAGAVDDVTTAVVYVADGGTGDGSTPETPVDTINSAIKVINDASATTGRIVLAGDVTISASTTETAHTKQITITSDSPATVALKIGANYQLRGDVTFENLRIISSSSTQRYIFACGYKLIMGAGIISEISGSGKYVGIIGGTAGTDCDKVDITIDSGTYTVLNVGAGIYGGNINGDVNCVVNEGATITSSINVGGNAGNGKVKTISGKVNLTINGATVNNIYIGNIFDSTKTATVTFNELVTVKINGGKFNGRIGDHMNAAVATEGKTTYSKGCIIDFSGFKDYTPEGLSESDPDTATFYTVSYWKSRVFDNLGFNYKVCDIMLVGAQDSFHAGDTTYSVRFVAALRNLEYDAAGFDIIAKDADGNTLYSVHKSVDHVYSSIKASDITGVTETITASEIGGNYILALTVRSIPVSQGKIIFEVTPYTVSGEVETPGATGTITYDSGVWINE